MKSIKFLTKIKIYLHNVIINFWYKKSLHFFFLLFYPLELIYKSILDLRKIFYRYQIFKTHKFNVPVIVIGNLTIGGTGKTSMAYYLAKYLINHGFKPAVVMRGYKSKVNLPNCIVPKNADPEIFGDEPVMLANNLACPVAIGVNRVKTVKLLLDSYDINVIISDDGLQHYALGRDLEILMINEDRYFGNLHQLPLGPLRDNLNKLNTIDFVVIKQKFSPENITTQPDAVLSDSNFNFNQFKHLKNIESKIIYLTLIPDKIYNLTIEDKYQDPIEFPLVHAVAAIGDNESFLALLQILQIKTINHKFPDHHCFTPLDLDFNDDLPIIMTEKDAIKCKSFAKHNFWYLKVEPKLTLSKELEHNLESLLL